MRRTTGTGRLSDTQVELLNYLWANWDFEDITGALKISRNTLRTRLVRLSRRLGQERSDWYRMPEDAKALGLWSEPQGWVDVGEAEA